MSVTQWIYVFWLVLVVQALYLYQGNLELKNWQGFYFSVSVTQWIYVFWLETQPPLPSAFSGQFWGIPSFSFIPFSLINSLEMFYNSLCGENTYQCCTMQAPRGKL